MKVVERRAAELAGIIAGKEGAWAPEEQEQLVSSLIRLQEIAAMERVSPLLSLLETCASEVRPCAKCGVKLAFVPTPGGKRAPISLESGLNHFADCPHAGEFRKGGAA